MISDAEFVAIRAFDKTLHRAVDNAQLIINEKNAGLVALAAHCRRLEAELEAERGRRRRAEFLLGRH